METHDQQDKDRQQGSGPPGEGERPPADAGQAGDPRAVATSDPAVASGPASEATRAPDRTTVIETGGVRGPGGAPAPQVLVVPVESSPPPGRPGRGSEAGHHEDAPSKPEKGDDHDRGGSGAGTRPQPAQAPSLTRILLYAGVVALVCGVAGAWGYSYFFGPSKSGDHKSSGKGANSGKDGGSGEGSDSGKGSDSGTGADSGSGKGSDGSKEGPSKAELRQAQAAWLAAVKESQQARAAEKGARHSEEQAEAVLEFLKQTLLSGGRSGDTPLADAFRAGGRGEDVTLSKALGGTEPQVAEAFADSPLGEARVRELLGAAYLGVGEPARAVKQYERALELRQALQGAYQPETAACRNQLAVAYRLAGQTTEAARLFERNPKAAAAASALAVRGSLLLREKKPAEAELKLRQSVTVLDKTAPDDWTTFDAKSDLGEALLEQRKFGEAEPFLVSGYEGLRRREETIPARDRSHVTKAVERLVRLYDAWGKEDEAARWRKEQKELAAAGRQGAGPS